MRDMLLVSHANPEDNGIAQWLALLTVWKSLPGAQPGALSRSRKPALRGVPQFGSLPGTGPPEARSRSLPRPRRPVSRFSRRNFYDPQICKEVCNCGGPPFSCSATHMPELSAPRVLILTIVKNC